MSNSDSASYTSDWKGLSDFSLSPPRQSRYKKRLYRRNAILEAPLPRFVSLPTPFRFSLAMASLTWLECVNSDLYTLLARWLQLKDQWDQVLVIGGRNHVERI